MTPSTVREEWCSIPAVWGCLGSVLLQLKTTAPFSVATGIPTRCSLQHSTLLPYFTQLYIHSAAPGCLSVHMTI